MNMNNNEVSSSKIKLSKQNSGYKINFKCFELEQNDRDKLDV